MSNKRPAYVGLFFYALRIEKAVHMNTKLKYLILAGGLLAIAVVAGWMVLVRADNFVDRKLTDYIRTSGKGKFQLDYKVLDIGFFPTEATLTEIHFFSHDSTFLELQDSLLLLPDLRVEQIRISGIGLFSLIFGSEIKVNELLIENPRLAVRILHVKADSVPSITWKSDGDKNKGFVLGQLRMVGGNLEWTSSKHKTFETAFEVSGADLSFNPSVAGLPFQTDSISIVLGRGTFFPENGLMAIDADSVSATYPSGEVALSGIRIYSRHDKYELSQVVGHQIDWLDLEIEKIAFQVTDPPKAVRENKLRVPSVRIRGLKGIVFKDKRWPFPERPDRAMPHQMIASIPFPLVIDSILLQESNIVYEEYVEKATEPGHVAFRQLEAKLTPLRNDTSMVAHLEARAMVMGEGRLEAHFDIPLQNGAGSYAAYGRLGQMDMKSVNEILQHSAGVSVESGRVDQLDFSFTYDDDSSSGEVHFAYSDLKVQLLDRDGEGVFSEVGEDIGSWFVNSFVAKTHNTPGDNFRTGVIEMERNKKKSIFNYWWKSLFSGLKSSITPGEKEE